jgi:hypothetical protein
VCREVTENGEITARVYGGLCNVQTPLCRYPSDLQGIAEPAKGKTTEQTIVRNDMRFIQLVEEWGAVGSQGMVMMHQADHSDLGPAA